jgi:hypothetical protein
MQTPMVMWDSESVESIYPLNDDSLYIKIDNENGVLRVNDYEASGAHVTTMGFVGPNAAANAKNDIFIAKHTTCVVEQGAI